MRKEFINPSNVFDSRKKYGYSQAIKAGNTIYLARQEASDEEGNLIGEGDIAAQTQQTYENIRRILAEAGATMNDIVRMTIFCKDIREFAREALNTGKIAKEYFGHASPPGSLIQVVGLGDSAMLLEIEATAVTSD
jgi:2-iminobutanoate/2-iminopropanoate deaminase